MSRLRHWWRSVKPRPKSVRATAVVAMPRAAAAVPDAMAAASLVGVSPIHGLYAAFIGPVIGGLASSTKLMVVTTTSAASLAAYSAVQGVAADDRLPSLFLLTILAGGIMVLAGLLGLGRLAGFVSHSVMVGFLSGVAASILLGQLPGLVGADVDATNAVAKALEIVAHPGLIDFPSLLVGVAALALLLWMPRTRLRKYAALVALVVPSMAVALGGYFGAVATVADSGEIARGFPLPVFPPISQFSFGLLAGAAAVAAIVLVQGAGVAQSFPNPDRTLTDQNTDFMSQGWANIGSGLLRGIPVGGSVSQTSLNVAVGAMDRWASIISGGWLLVVLVLLSGLVGRVATPTLAAILVIASIGAIRPVEIAAVWQSGAPSQIAMVTTFAATLYLPVAAAVGIGVALSMLLNINRQAQDVRIVRLVETDDGALSETKPPDRLQPDTVTVLDVYGSLFYAGARTLEAKLPHPDTADRAVVVIRMRGRTVVGATAFSVLQTYANTLAEDGGRLYLSGVDAHLVAQFRQAGRIDSSGPIRIVEATPTLGESTHRAIAQGEGFLIHGTRRDNESEEPSDPVITRLWRKIGRLWSR